MWFIAQALNLSHPLHQRFGGIGQHQTGTILQSQTQDLQKIRIDKRLPTRERKCLNTHFERFIHKASDIIQSQKFDALIPGFRSFKTERAAQIAIGSGMKPELLKGLWLDITTRLITAGIKPSVTVVHFHKK